MKKIEAVILENYKVSDHFYKLRLESAYLAKHAKPGQFIEVRCASTSAGASDTILRRPLGVHRVTKKGIDVLYQVVGKGTGILSCKAAGEEIDLIGPLGNGFQIKNSKKAILVAGGIGVAPLVALAEGLGSGLVIIGAKTKAHVACSEEFKEFGLTVKVATEDGSRGIRGLATELLMQALKKVDQEECHIYACGPTGMLRAVAGIAHAHRIPCQVSLEEHMACGVGVCLGCPVKMKATGEYKMVCKDGPVFDAEEISW